MGNLYYRTPHWRKIRALKLREADYCCEACGRGKETSRLDVHHIYGVDSIEHRNDLSALSVLCRACHRKRHGSRPGPGRPGGFVRKQIQNEKEARWRQLTEELMSEEVMNV